MLAIQALAHGVEGQQAVDGKVPTHLVEKLQVANAVQPVGVVHHQTVIAGRAHMHEAGEGLADAGDIVLDLRLTEHRPALVAKARVADARGRAADQQDRAMAKALQPAHHHQPLQMADMQAVGGGIDAQVNGRAALLQVLAQAVEIGALVDKTAFLEELDGVLWGVHGSLLVGGARGDRNPMDPIRLRRIGMHTATARWVRAGSCNMRDYSLMYS